MFSGWAHPRVCGENGECAGARTVGAGSSPRMRGKLANDPNAPADWGLIPAYAGKTSPILTEKLGLMAHPRVCGENDLFDKLVVTLIGSSPRMRGKPMTWPHFATFFGLIPAYAGKTRSVRTRLPTAGAHPRVCGENTERSGVLTLRSVRSWKTLSFPSSLKVTHCRAFVQLSLSRIRL